MILGSFNAAPAQDAERTVCLLCVGYFREGDRWPAPLPGPGRALTAIDTVFSALSGDDIVEAMRSILASATAPSAAGCRRRAVGAAAASDEVRQGLVDGNVAYEQRFGHVFLICASGLSGQEMLDQLRARLDNDEEAERAVVRAELKKITHLRMTKMLSP